MTGFGERVRHTIAENGPLCVGIDPHEALLRAWGLEVSASGVRDFGLRTVEAAAGRVGIVKPQVSFFERFGSAGFAALEEVVAAARVAGLIVIADAKRGDIGTTMDAYAAAWLTPGVPLEADALTVNPYLGVGALTDTFDLADTHGKGVFVLAATSNPEAIDLQRAISQGADQPPRTLPHLVIDDVTAWALARGRPDQWSPIGFVVGATVDHHFSGLPEVLRVPAPILAPGFGAQGAEPAQLRDRFGKLAPFVIGSESRSILSAGPDGLAARIEERAALYRRER
ncbi:orotidine-5'-phosphate decarboxylase [Microbacterium sp.]|uniref:orotidine-5'-phosphate decarboxylase n=1 Tax=Microbacterium sp. TaxID=51671 RepID=UPI0039E239DC